MLSLIWCLSLVRLSLEKLAWGEAISNLLIFRNNGVICSCSRTKSQNKKQTNKSPKYMYTFVKLLYWGTWKWRMSIDQGKGEATRNWVIVTGRKPARLRRTKKNRCFQQGDEEIAVVETGQWEKRILSNLVSLLILIEGGLINGIPKASWVLFERDPMVSPIGFLQVVTVQVLIQGVMRRDKSEDWRAWVRKKGNG